MNINDISPVASIFTTLQYLLIVAMMMLGVLATAGLPGSLLVVGVLLTLEAIFS